MFVFSDKTFPLDWNIEPSEFRNYYYCYSLIEFTILILKIHILSKIQTHNKHLGFDFWVSFGSYGKKINLGPDDWSELRFALGFSKWKNEPIKIEVIEKIAEGNGIIKHSTDFNNLVFNQIVRDAKIKKILGIEEDESCFLIPSLVSSDEKAINLHRRILPVYWSVLNINGQITKIGKSIFWFEIGKSKYYCRFNFSNNAVQILDTNRKGEIIYQIDFYIKNKNKKIWQAINQLKDLNVEF